MFVRLKRICWLWAASTLALPGCQRTETPLEPVDSVASVEVTPAQVEIPVGETIRLSAVARRADGGPLEERILNWVSEREDLASVDGSGLVSGRAPGIARITAETGGKSAWADVKVSTTPQQILRIERLDPESIQAG